MTRRCQRHTPTSISTTANKMTHSRFIFISTKVYKSGCKKKEGGAIRRGGCTALLLFSYRTGCLSPCDALGCWVGEWACRHTISVGCGIATDGNRAAGLIAAGHYFSYTYTIRTTIRTGGGARTLFCSNAYNASANRDITTSIAGASLHRHPRSDTGTSIGTVLVAC